LIPAARQLTDREACHDFAQYAGMGLRLCCNAFHAARNGCARYAHASTGASTTRSFAIDQKEGLEDTAPADGTFAAYHYTSVASASLD
jgi:hypothetical protein